MVEKKNTKKLWRHTLQYILNTQVAQTK